MLIKSSFLRGIADTDFSVTFKKRSKTLPYPVLDFQINDKLLRDSVADLLAEKGITFSIGDREKFRKNKVSYSYYLQISGRENLKNWLKKIGFENSKHIKRIRTHLGP